MCWQSTDLCLTASIAGKPIPECQTVLHFLTARDVGDGRMPVGAAKQAKFHYQHPTLTGCSTSLVLNCVDCGLTCIGVTN